MMSCFSTTQSLLCLFCCFLFVVFNNCWYTTPSFPFNYHKKLITYTANNHLNPKLIPELLNNLGGKASDVMLNHLHKIKLFWPRNHYNNNKMVLGVSGYPMIFSLLLEIAMFFGYIQLSISFFTPNRLFSDIL